MIEQGILRGLLKLIHKTRPYSGHIGYLVGIHRYCLVYRANNMTYSRIAVFCNITIVELLHYIIDLQKQLPYITNNMVYVHNIAIRKLRLKTLMNTLLYTYDMLLILRYTESVVEDDMKSLAYLMCLVIVYATISRLDNWYSKKTISVPKRFIIMIAMTFIRN